LSPAKILQTIPNDETKRMKVVVTEDQLSLAIGKNGQNARLAAKLTGWEIDLVSEEDFAASRGETRRSDLISVEELESLGKKTTDSLIQAGFESVQDIVKASIEDLMNVPGVGDVTAQKIYLAAVQHIEQVEEDKARAAAEKAEEEAAPTELVFLDPPAEDVEVEVEVVAEVPPAVVEPAAAVSEVPEPIAATEVEPKPKPKPKPRPDGTPGSYLDDIEAMESELTSGWEETEEPDSKEERSDS
jgi:N utilization substance protein A